MRVALYTYLIQLIFMPGRVWGPAEFIYKC